jgi:hypothetical protein
MSAKEREVEKDQQLPTYSVTKLPEYSGKQI